MVRPHRQAGLCMWRTGGSYRLLSLKASLCNLPPVMAGNRVAVPGVRQPGTWRGAPFLRINTAAAKTAFLYHRVSDLSRYFLCILMIIDNIYLIVQQSTRHLTIIRIFSLYNYRDRSGILFQQRCLQISVRSAHRSPPSKKDKRKAEAFSSCR